MNEIELLKFKLEFNYVLARFRNSEVYFATKEEEFKKLKPIMQDKIIKTAEELSERLLVLKLQYKQLTGIDMTEEELNNGFKE